jgi:NitT/TauT family transport system permease protein
VRLVNRRPGRLLALFLAALPFALALAVYAGASAARLAENPDDRLLPSLAQIAETAQRLVTEPDRRSGRVLFWDDTLASLGRLAAGVGIAAALGLGLGVAIGLIPLARAALAPFVAAVAMAPPLALLPILFLALGLGEASKIALIVIGTAPVLVRDLAQRVAEIPRELLVKAQTLGASSGVIALRLALPLALPRLAQAVRLALGPAWLFLIAAEAIASTEGLGYRIFLVRRFLAMDVILVYVVWIALLAAAMDWGLRALARRAFPWAGTAAS